MKSMPLPPSTYIRINKKDIPYAKKSKSKLIFIFLFNSKYL